MTKLNPQEEAAPPASSPAKATPEKKTTPARRAPTEARAASPAPRRTEPIAPTQDVLVDLGGARAASPAPKLPPSPPFIYAAHRERFMVMCGQVIPVLTKVKIQVGLQQVTARLVEDPITKVKKERFNIDACLADWRKRGYREVPWTVDGPGTTYLKRPELAPHAVISRFEKVYPGSTAVDCDEAAYVAWCRSLVDRGIVDPPPLYVLDRLAGKIQEDLGRVADKAEHVPSYRDLVKRLEADLAVVQREIENVTRETAPAPAGELDAEDLIETGGGA